MDPTEKQAPETGGSEQDGARVAADPAVVAQVQHQMQVQQRFSRGAGAFAGVALFSVLNTALIHLQAGFVFVGVLWFTKIVDVLAFSLTGTLGSWVVLVGLGIDLAVAYFFLWLSRKAGQHLRWPFYLGGALYALDGAVALFFNDWIEVAFHAWILSSVWDGLKASQELQQLAAAEGEVPTDAPGGAEGEPEGESEDGVDPLARGPHPPITPMGS